MRHVTLIMTASIDGFVDAPAGHAGFLPEPQELERWKLDRIRRAGTHIMGRVSYEITALRNQPGGEIIAWGGARFAQALSRAQLINKYVIITQPVAYGGGASMFTNLPDALHLDLVTSTTYASGTTLRIFEPRGWGRDLEERNG